MARSTKFIFVTGGVISSLGKGISAAAIGALLESRGLRVNFLKLDPYINVDPGTMNPLQHGEVYVTEDGAETDMDLGHYERFTHTQTRQVNNCTAGRIYYRVITKERRGDYLGGTVQVIPHITDEIQLVFREGAQNCDVAIIETGGTVGDIESLPFLEAIRQFRGKQNRGDVINIHVTLVPYIKTADEMKTKPSQHSVAALREIGIQPDILLCRGERDLPMDIRRKLALFCNVEEDCIFGARDVESIYMMPSYFRSQNLDGKICELLNIWTKEPDIKAWEDICEIIRHPAKTVNIALVGKYVKLHESYKSLIEALNHGGYANDCKVNLSYIDSEELESLSEAELAEVLEPMDGILVPGGFGVRGTEGKIRAVRYARLNRVPLFGICLGMQMALVEYARDVCGWTDANSSEFVPDSTHPVIHLMASQAEVTDKGGTMRLGAYPCKLADGSRVREIYGKREISERHRHRYEVNNALRGALEEAGVVFSGTSPDDQLVEIFELKDHPWFVCTQFHPEYQSKPTAAHPLFASFIHASLENAK
ncbi:MAG: CTP synthase [Proteobacteria bacterium]|nr:CTP synthase [Pseudomonadota bacterium]